MKNISLQMFFVNTVIGEKKNKCLLANSAANNLKNERS